MADVNRSCTAYAGGESMRVAKSKVIDIVLDTANRIIAVPIPKKAYVNNIQLYMTETCDAGTLDIGFIGNGEVADVNYFASAIDLAGKAAGALVSGLEDAIGKYFTSAPGSITFSPVKGAGTTGKFQAIVSYTVIH